MFDTIGYLVIPGALSPAETEACLEASRRAHAAYPRGQWRQLGHLYETEPAIEQLIDHPAVLPKVRALMGEWNRPEEPFGVGYERPPFQE